jgi:hypothetical protein|tara:strand:+ start:1052 stop:1288 length:237 start_codon:yes stop_codon:yes gene_type:complete
MNQTSGNLHADGGMQVGNSNNRPQTSHGRGRRGRPADNVVKREQKHVGLGETSKDVFALEEEEDISKRQILMEKKEYS